MEDLSLHILDIAENSIDAGAGRIEIGITEDEACNLFTLIIKDDGRGMDAETIAKIRDPFFTTKSVRRFGLGIPLLAQAAKECNGRFLITSAPGGGTTVTAEFELDHIDRKPLGDIGTTMMVLIAGHPEITFIFSYEKHGLSYTFDSSVVSRELEGIPINLPDVLQLIRDDINEGVRGN
ncbi:MAG: ATP-binding protein [Nitrospirota bacterium]